MSGKLLDILGGEQEELAAAAASPWVLGVQTFLLDGEAEIWRGKPNAPMIG
jgi:hypothetical protein